MQSTDKKEKERADARNALEEYVYEFRSAISDGGYLKIFASQGEKSTFLRLLDDTENWLYEEGENCNKQVSISTWIWWFYFVNICFIIMCLFLDLYWKIRWIEIIGWSHQGA